MISRCTRRGERLPGQHQTIETLHPSDVVGASFKGFTHSIMRTVSQAAVSLTKKRPADLVCG